MVSLYFRENRGMRVRVTRLAIGVLVVIGASSSQAQSTRQGGPDAPPALETDSAMSLSIPVIETRSSGKYSRPVLALEAAKQVDFEVAGMFAKLSIRQDHYPIDSILKEWRASAATWQTQVPKNSVRGMQIPASGTVGLQSGDDRYASEEFARRLATPNLSFEDKAFTLQTAVQAFTNQWHPERLGMAEQYMHTLDALGDSAAVWRFIAHSALANTYYVLGRSQDVARHGKTAIALLPVMPYHERYLAYLGNELYAITVDALAGMPQGRAAIESLDTAYLAGTVITPGLVAFDSTYAIIADGNRRSAHNAIVGNAKLGTPAAPLVAHYWVNRGSHDSTTVVMNDGKIRLIEMAHTGCGPCVKELYALQQIHEHYPAIETMLMTWTFGQWGDRVVDRDEEIAHLVQYFVTDTKITYPVGIWAGVRIPNREGGTSVQENANFANYPLTGKPMLWVIDGHGIIRRMFTGYGPDMKLQIERTIDFLQHEAGAPAASSVSSSIVTH